MPAGRELLRKLSGRSYKIKELMFVMQKLVEDAR
jgi:hypothetical protein